MGCYFTMLAADAAATMLLMRSAYATDDDDID